MGRLERQDLSGAQAQEPMFWRCRRMMSSYSFLFRTLYISARSDGAQKNAKRGRDRREKKESSAVSAALYSFDRFPGIGPQLLRSVIPPLFELHQARQSLHQTMCQTIAIAGTKDPSPTPFLQTQAGLPGILRDLWGTFKTVM